MCIDSHLNVTFLPQVISFGTLSIDMGGREGGYICQLGVYKVCQVMAIVVTCRHTIHSRGFSDLTTYRYSAPSLVISAVHH